MTTVRRAIYSQLSLEGHLYKTDTSVKRTSRVCPCLSVLPLFADGHLVPVPAISILERVDCGKVPLLYAAVASNRVLYAVLMPGVKHMWHC